MLYEVITAFHSEKTRILFEDSEGMISGETILAYPPGIPIICPGERNNFV